MMIVDKLGRLDKIILSRMGRWRQHWRQRATPVSGLPDGLSYGTVDAFCRAELGSPLGSVSYIHLSGWKQSGAYRLFVRAENGRSRQLIYKNAIYNPAQTPALKGLPVTPGVPEYLIYRHGDVLRPYLPQIYLCAEVVPGRHYRYLLEDMAQGHEPLSTNQARQLRRRKKWVLAAAAELPQIHQLLRQWSELVDQERLLRYDRTFSKALLVYAHENLSRYVRETADTAVATLLQQWADIAALHWRDDFHDPQYLRPIHGDYHTTNIYIRRARPRHLKLIDWEWTGFGKAHTDLAALLNRATPELEREALALYAAREPHLSLAQHRTLYEWCQLDRGLLDTAFLARQQLDSGRQVAWIPQFIQKSINRVQQAYAWLTGGAPSTT